LSRIPQVSNGKGSLKDIQKLINDNVLLLDTLIKQKFKELRAKNIEWKSPIKSDDYAEYRDTDFIKKLWIKIKIPLSSFWPTRGPQWDGLGRTSENEIFLIEAKANIPEVVSPATQASKNSLSLIEKSLADTKKYLGITNNVSWSGKFYQYSNRIAHLYFLRVLNKIPAYLINIYFINDKSVSGPKCREEWIGAVQVVKAYLGLSNNKLSKYTADIFIDVNDMK
jgi:hypothetical protein